MGKFKESIAIDEQIKNIFETDYKKITTPVCAFVTFTT